VATAVLEVGFDIPDLDSVVVFPQTHSSCSPVQQCCRPAFEPGVRGDAIVYVKKADLEAARTYAETETENMESVGECFEIPNNQVDFDETANIIRVPQPAATKPKGGRKKKGSKVTGKKEPSMPSFDTCATCSSAMYQHDLRQSRGSSRLWEV
jgi:ERCC4-related helicase